MQDYENMMELRSKCCFFLQAQTLLISTRPRSTRLADRRPNPLWEPRFPKYDDQNNGHQNRTLNAKWIIYVPFFFKNCNFFTMTVIVCSLNFSLKTSITVPRNSKESMHIVNIVLSFSHNLETRTKTDFKIDEKDSYFYTYRYFTFNVMYFKTIIKKFCTT